ncbi:MAG: glycosyl hydrolase, partial [Bacteroidota bacterium]|nr:glycosyl hydrolase [Bacteroidota bacterium]
MIPLKYSRYISKALVLLFTTVFSQSFVQAQKITAPNPLPLSLLQDHWVDSVYNSLSKDERIAQMLMVAAYSNRGKAHEDSIINLIQKHKIGGLIFFQGGPVRQAHLVNKYQSHSKVPLMVAMDLEWGLGMRLD